MFIFAFPKGMFLPMKRNTDKRINTLQWKKLFIAMIFACLCLGAKAQAYTDTLSVTVYFPCGSSNIAKYPANIKSLEDFILQLDSVGQIYVIKPVSLSLTSSTSPEGGLNINRKISRRRGQAALDYLINHSETFREISSAIECQTDELTTNHLRSKTKRTKYPKMRYAKVTLHITGESKEPVVVDVESETCDSIPEETEIIPIIVPSDAVATEPPVIVELPDSLVCRPILFMKTNLLYDLLTVVNASVEVPITDRFTIEGTYVNPWWRDTSNHKTLQIRYGAITPRYYFMNTDEPYTSFFAGLTVGTGKYDLQWTRRGVQGTMWNVSPTFGYSHYIAKRWKMEYSASVGYLQTEYWKYTQVYDTQKYGTIKVKDYPWVSHTLKTVFPVSLNVSIVYTFNHTKRIKHHER